MKNFFKFSDLQNINKKVVFFDLGANIGIITNKVINLNIKDLQIFSFEPVSSNFKILQDKFSNFKNIELENKAAWIDNSKKKFSVGIKSNHTNSKFSSLVKKHKWDSRKYTEEVSVDCIDITDYIDRHTRKEGDFIVVKMDIEGSEREVLNRFITNKKIVNKIDVMLIEFHKFSESEEIDILKRLTALNQDIQLYKEFRPGTYKLMS